MSGGPVQDSRDTVHRCVGFLSLLPFLITLFSFSDLSLSLSTYWFFPPGTANPRTATPDNVRRLGPPLVLRSTEDWGAPVVTAALGVIGWTVVPRGGPATVSGAHQHRTVSLAVEVPIRLRISVSTDSALRLPRSGMESRPPVVPSLSCIRPPIRSGSPGVDRRSNGPPLGWTGFGWT